MKPEEITIGSFVLLTTPLTSDVTIRHKHKDRQLVAYVCRGGCHDDAETMDIAKEIVAVLTARGKK